tara:strand:- start:220 stop:498 length:279 start_codon:yes stop_codon:yes gene_type:complete
MSNEITTFNKDIEDDVIDQGLTSNIDEALDYYQLDEYNIKSRNEPFLNEKVEQDYHNSYYKDGQHRTRSLRMNNKEWHKMRREQLNTIIDEN